VEYEGTYPLPEAELDRFVFKAIVRYPSAEDERAILRAHDRGQPSAKIVEIDPFARGTLEECRGEIENVTVEDSVLDYVVRIAAESRRSPDLILGASPRAAVHLLRAAKAAAAIDGRDFVTPDDVKSRATPSPSSVQIERVAEPQLSIGVGSRVTVRLRNPFALPLRATVRDTVPPSFDVDRRTADLVVGPGAVADAAYAARPRHRGSFRFGDVHLRLRGPLDLLQRQGRVPADAPANVYPDLQEIRRYEVSLRRGLAYDAGQRRARIPGAGSLFERLREYQPDDDPRSISWAATARRGRPISVEYETERQQRILILLDAGRMMSSTLGGLTN